MEFLRIGALLMRGIMKSVGCVAVSCVIVLVTSMASLAAETSDDEFRMLRDDYVKSLKPLEKEMRLAGWESSVTGSDKAYARKEKAVTALARLNSDRDLFKKLVELKKAGSVRDPLLARQLDVMYRTMLSGQADEKLQKQIIALENKVSKVFTTHRSVVSGEELTENDVLDILRKTTNSAEAKDAWLGYMEVGRKVESGLRELVTLRNRLAKEAGFDNYYLLKLAEQELDPGELDALFDELDRLTRSSYEKLKKEIDLKIAMRFQVPVTELKPWHFGDLFFQGAPETGGSGSAGQVNLDDLFRSVDMVAVSKKYFAGMGLDCSDILARSDLYEKQGKTPHAFCTDIDREGDVRVLCNLKPNLSWADTILHELGHAVYDKYIDREMPYLLRTASHSTTTEGIALMFGAMVKNEDWLNRVLEVPAMDAAAVSQAARKTLLVEKIVFSRWAQVMLRFERSMYANPDQDLSKLWWDLKKEYQLLTPPDDARLPGYAAKAHVLMWPVYYHGYMMGDLFYSQVHAYVAREILNGQNPQRTSFAGRKEVGEYLKGKVFSPGNKWSWNELTRRATGEQLTAKYFARQFVE